MNSVNLIGRWTRDIDMKYTQQGKAVATATLAVDDGYGQNKKTYFHSVVMWEKTAEAVSQYSGKGKRVAVSGKLTQRSWEKDGNKVFVTEILAHQVEFLEPKEQAQQNSKSDPFQDDGKPVDVDPDDLPF